MFVYRFLSNLVRRFSKSLIVQDYYAYLRSGKKFQLIFSDEADLRLNGFVNKQNCRYWGKANPKNCAFRGMCEFDENDADDFYLQQDRAPPHVSRINMDTLR